MRGCIIRHFPPRQVPLLLAARDAHLAAAAAATAAAAEAEQRAAGEVVPLAPPDEFVCAISQQLMVDPVTAVEGAAAILDSVSTVDNIHCQLLSTVVDCCQLDSVSTRSRLASLLFSPSE